MSTKKLSGEQLRKFRRDVAKLKKKGLVSKGVKPRSQKPTYYMRKQVERYSDVIEGKASVVKAPSRKAASEYKGAAKVKGDRIVIPKRKGEKPARYGKAGLERRAKLYDYDVVRIYPKLKFGDWTDIPQPGPGERYIYRLPVSTWGGEQSYLNYEFLDDLKDFVESNRQGSFKYYRNAPSYVEVYKIVGGDEEDLEDILNEEGEF